MKKYLLYWLWILTIYCIFAYHYTKKYGPIVIYSEWLLDTASVINGLEKWSAKALALPPPFVGLRRKNHEMNDTWIRHEQIHHLQQSETLFLSVIVGQMEKLYAKHILNKPTMEAYLRESTEQEAYLNQTDPTYIQQRKIFSTRKYIKNKVDFELVDYQVVYR